MTKEERRCTRIGKILVKKDCGIRTYREHFFPLYSLIQSIRAKEKNHFVKLLKHVRDQDLDCLVLGKGNCQCTLERKLHIYHKYVDNLLRNVLQNSASINTFQENPFYIDCHLKSIHLSDKVSVEIKHELDSLVYSFSGDYRTLLGKIKICIEENDLFS